MGANVIDGKRIAKDIIARAARERADLGFSPGLGVVLVGDDPASHLYVGLKEKACKEIGIAFERVYLSADAGPGIVLRAVEAINRRQDIDAILVQLPLPPHLNANAVIAAMDPEKDVDGFHPDNVERLRNGDPVIVPGLAAGILALIKSTGEPLAGKRALVVANSPEFYAPVETVLRSAGLSPSFARPDEAGARTRDADVLVVAVGMAGWLTGAMVKPGAIVIDVGTNKAGGKTVGDADASVAEVASHLTPVPGGVGPVTVAMLVKNAVALAKRRKF